MKKPAPPDPNELFVIEDVNKLLQMGANWIQVESVLLYDKRCTPQLRERIKKGMPK